MAWTNLRACLRLAQSRMGWKSGGTENATQRGNLGTAATGTVAAAARYALKEALTGTSRKFPGRSLETIRGQIASDKGGGQDVNSNVTGG